MSKKNVIALPENSLEILPDGEVDNALMILVGRNAQGKPTEVQEVDITTTTSKDVEVFLQFRGGVLGTQEVRGNDLEEGHHFGAYWTFEAPGKSSGASGEGRVTLEKIEFLGKCDLEGVPHEVYQGVPEFDGDLPPGR